MEQNKGSQDFTQRRWNPAELPNLPIFNRLINHAHLRNTVCVRDANASISMTHHQLLTDVVNLRNSIHGNPDFRLDGTGHEKSEASIGLLAPGGCQFAVGFLATLALGAVCVPLSKQDPRVPILRANGVGRYRISSTGIKLLCAKGSDRVSSRTSRLCRESQRLEIVYEGETQR